MFVSQRRDRDYWREYVGVGPDHYALAAIVNAVNDNTRATGQWRKSPPKFEPFPIPSIAAEKAKKAATAKAKRRSVKDLYQQVMGFTSRMPGAKQ